MRCSSDLRKRVVSFVRAGGSKREAALRYGVGEASVYRWLSSEDATAYSKPGPRGPHKINLEDLARNVREHDDWTYAERADHFGVSDFCISHNLRRLRVSRKKNDAVQAARSYEKKGVPSSS